VKRMRVSSYVAERIGRTREDFRLDTFRSGGKGGQHQNKTESGVRITDRVTGLSRSTRHGLSRQRTAAGETEPPRNPSDQPPAAGA